MELAPRQRVLLLSEILFCFLRLALPKPSYIIYRVLEVQWHCLQEVEHIRQHDRDNGEIFQEFGRDCRRANGPVEGGETKDR